MNKLVNYMSPEDDSPQRSSIMGYWGEALNEKSDDDWYKEFLDLLIKYNKDNITATVLECHI